MSKKELFIPTRFHFDFQSLEESSKEFTGFGKMTEMIDRIRQRRRGKRRKREINPRTTSFEQSFTDESDSDFDSHSLPVARTTSSRSEPHSESSEDELSLDFPEMAREQRSFTPEQETIFHQTRSYLQDAEPSLRRVFEGNLSLVDRARLLELYEIYLTTPAPSLERVELREQFHRELARAHLEAQADLPAEVHQTLQRLEKKPTLSLAYQIALLLTSEENRNLIYQRYLEWNQGSGEEKEKAGTWLHTVLRYPFDRVRMSGDLRLLGEARQRLDQRLYGMEKVKDNLMAFVNARLRNPQMKECTLGLIGPPGVGKTALIRTVAEVFQLPFAQISCGVLADLDSLRGFSYTYIGSQPGALVQAVTRLGVKNGMIFFDEFEKVATNERLWPSLLQILDPEQNHEYQDNYFGELKLDLSQLWFTFSMNREVDLPELRDRVYPLHVPGYTLEERKKIVEDYSLPRLASSLGFKPKEVRFTSRGLDLFLSLCPEEGVRQANHLLRELLVKLRYLDDYPGVPVSFACPVKKPYRLTPEVITRLRG